MRSGPNTRRPMRRGNNNSGGGRRSGSPRSQSFDSNGPDIKVRGNAQQVVDKYQALAREASTAGDPVMAENYYQHAEHYFRVLNANGGGDNRQGNRSPDNNNNGERDNGNGADDNRQQTNGAASDGAPAPAPPAAAAVANGAEQNNHKQSAETEAVPKADTLVPPAESAPVDAKVNEEGKEAVKAEKKAKPAQAEEETTEPAA